MAPSLKSAGLAALANAIAVSAHGHIYEIIAEGQAYSGYNPLIAPWLPVQDSPAWANWATDNGYVPSSAVGDPDIICHLDADNAPLTVAINAGSEITVKWTDWPRSHHGPVVDYLAKCDGDCESVDKTELKFFKIAELGQLELGAGQGSTGYWASDVLIDDNSEWTVTIPATIAPGNYVLRHEQIALHNGYDLGEAQMYPQCINLVVSSDGTHEPEGVLGTELYSPTDAGLYHNIYNDETNPSYEIPGPPLYQG